MERWGHSKRRHDEETLAGGSPMLNSIANFFRGLFGRKADNFKDLLIADLGIER